MQSDPGLNAIVLVKGLGAIGSNLNKVCRRGITSVPVFLFRQLYCGYVRCQYLGKLGWRVYGNSVLLWQHFKKSGIISKWKVKNQKLIINWNRVNRREKERKQKWNRMWPRRKEKWRKRRESDFHEVRGYTCCLSFQWPPASGNSAYVLGGNIHWGTASEEDWIPPHIQERPQRLISDIVSKDWYIVSALYVSKLWNSCM